MAKTVQEAKDWFVGKATTANGYRRNIMNKLDRQRGNAVAGRMYFFRYDAKGKKTLPMWDKFPMVFPIEPYADGFLGLNLHYLPAGQRAALLNRLKGFANNKKYDDTTRLKLNYDMVSGIARLQAFKPCIKRYLYSHVQSHFIEIKADEWDNVIALPTEQFVYRTGP